MIHMIDLIKKNKQKNKNNQNNLNYNNIIIGQKMIFNFKYIIIKKLIFRHISKKI